MKTPKKQLGLMALISLVSGNMIGSGIFLLPSILASLGTISLFSWGFSAVGAIGLALVFSHLSTLIPKSGGPYSYVRAQLGRFLGFQTAYLYWLATWVGNSAVAVALVGYLRVFFPVLHQIGYAFVVAAGVVWLFTLVNIMGVRSAGFIQTLTTLLKLIPILLIGVLGWFYVHPHYYTQYANITQPHLSNMAAFSKGASLTVWAFIGLESATVPAGSVKNPRRMIPLATLIGTLLAALVYISSSSVIMGMIPASILQHSTAPFADAAKQMLGGLGEYLMAIGAVIACLGALNGWILLQGQVPMAASEDRLFPQWFAKKNRAGVPVKGIIATSILITLLLLFTLSPDLVRQFNTIILLAVIANVIPYLYTVIADVLYLCQSQLSLVQKVRKGLIALIGGFFSAWAIYSCGVSTVYYGCFLLLSSVVVYGLGVHRDSAFEHQTIQQDDSDGC